jgi:hypothetical protein
MRKLILLALLSLSSCATVSEGPKLILSDKIDTNQNAVLMCVLSVKRNAVMCMTLDEAEKLMKDQDPDTTHM